MLLNNNRISKAEDPEEEGEEEGEGEEFHIAHKEEGNKKQRKKE